MSSPGGTLVNHDTACSMLTAMKHLGLACVICRRIHPPARERRVQELVDIVLEVVEVHVRLDVDPERRGGVLVVSNESGASALVGIDENTQVKSAVA
eukprot:2679981-Heterocapsa_arctica.AAC.1